MEQNIVLYILAVFILRIKICTGISCNSSVFKIQFQILEKEFPQIDLCDVQLSFCFLQYRRCEHFPDRNIDICHTVFKCGLFGRIGKRMNLYIQIRAVSVTAFDVHTVRRIQHINDLLLHIAVKHIIKRIDMHRFRKDFFVFFSDGRNRVSNNRKTAFLPVNVMIDQLALLAALIHIDFPLFVGIGNALLFLLRRKRLCPENFDHCRSSVIWSNRFVIFPDSTMVDSGLIEQLALFVCRKRKVSRFLTNVYVSLLISLLSLPAAAGVIPVLHDKVVIGAIMPLVPGIALTTSIRDFYNGDYLSGTIHLIDALLTALCIAVGIALPILLLRYGGNLPV